MSLSIFLLTAAILSAPGGPESGGSTPDQRPDRPRPVRSKLRAPQEIEGIPCGPGYVWHFPDGRLHSCRLDRDATVRGADLPKGSTVAFRPDGTHAYVFLPRTTTIEGYECRGSGHNFMTVFHPDGRLKLCWMPKNRTVHGVPCAGFSVWADILTGNPSGVYLHPNGRLADCRLSADVTVDGKLFSRGKRIFLDEEGHPVPPRPR